MSAFMCSARHITALAAYCVRNGLSGIRDTGQGAPAMVQEIFGILARENMLSVDERYPAEPDAPLPELDRKAMLEVFPPLLIIKCCHCYAYQSCEHRGWPNSHAKLLIEAIESHAVRHLPGYDALPWGI